eukprot:362961-Chlamydomonas_euryale.AAC.1
MHHTPLRAGHRPLFPALVFAARTRNISYSPLRSSSSSGWIASLSMQRSTCQADNGPWEGRRPWEWCRSRKKALWHMQVVCPRKGAGHGAKPGLWEQVTGCERCEADKGGSR